MKKATSYKLLRVPVRLVDGFWECAYGGIVPAKENSEAELVLNTKSIADKAFLSRMLNRSSIRVLDEGVTLLVYLATKKQENLTTEQKSHLIPWKSRQGEIATEFIDSWSSGGLSLVEVTIGNLTASQSAKFGADKGGLWLLTEGPKAVGLQSSRVRLPDAVSKQPVNSLNHAMTKLSEIYEPWRISHTGNVYQRFLYKEKNGKWYPLEILRNAALAQKEQEIAYQLWQDFLNRMSGNAIK